MCVCVYERWAPEGLQPLVPLLPEPQSQAQDVENGLLDVGRLLVEQAAVKDGGDVLAVERDDGFQV